MQQLKVYPPTPPQKKKHLEYFCVGFFLHTRAQWCSHMLVWYASLMWWQWCPGAFYSRTPEGCWRGGEAGGRMSLLSQPKADARSGWLTFSVSHKGQGYSLGLKSRVELQASSPRKITSGCSLGGFGAACLYSWQRYWIAYGFLKNLSQHTGCRNLSIPEGFQQTGWWHS